jgi:hypothetical protein
MMASTSAQSDANELAIQQELQVQLRLDMDDVLSHKTFIELAEPGQLRASGAKARIELLKGLEENFKKNSRLLKMRTLSYPGVRSGASARCYISLQYLMKFLI